MTTAHHIFLSRYGFSRDLDPCTMYLLHLASVDSLLSFVLLLKAWVDYFAPGWWIRETCVFTSILRMSLITLDWLSLALMTTTHCLLLSLSAERRSALRGDWPRCMVPVAVVWAAVFVWLMPALYKVRRTHVCIKRSSTWLNCTYTINRICFRSP